MNPPYRATTIRELMKKILHEKPKPVSMIRPELRRFDGIFERLLAKRKEERYQSVEEFLKDVKNATRGA